MDEQNEMLEAEEVESEETNQDELDFSDTGANETETAEPSLEESNSEEESKSGQNAMQAEKRRMRDEKEAALRKKIEDNAYRKGIIEALGGVNPYTGEDIKDNDDIEEYFTMRELDKSGKDPVMDYRQTMKEKRKAEQNAKADRDKTAQEIADFAQAFPDVDLDTLFKDERFLKFAGKRVDHEGLSDVYADFVAFTDSINSEAMKKAQIQEKSKLARAKASPGSLTGDGTAAQQSYATMSDEAFERKMRAVLRGDEKI